MHTIDVSDEVRDILQRSTVTMTTVRLPPVMLERPTYEAVDKVLKALGGKWKGPKNGHVFTTDPRAAIADIIKGVELIDKKEMFQAFFTPDAAADLLVTMADIEPDQRVLEPSAGDGAIIRAIRRAVTPIAVIAVELDVTHFPKLTKIANRVHPSDFLALPRVVLGTFDRVVMNPPFSNGQDVRHVCRAWEYLRPGGRLAAIVSPAFRYRREAAFKKFKELHAEHGEEERDLPAGTFKESGTMVATVAVCWRKPL